MKLVRNLGVLGTSLGIILLTTAFILSNFVYLNKPLCIASESTVLVTSFSPHERGWGSGVIFNTKDFEGNKKTFIWTCFHVVSNQVNIDVVFDAKTQKNQLKMQVNNPKISSKIFNNAPEEIGEVSLTAKIIRFSEWDDLAILEISSDIYRNNVSFPRKGYRPGIGTKIFHVGCFSGPHGERSVSEGITGVIGLNLDNDGKLYDRVGLSFEPGSSGGGVFESSTGKCIGIIARRINGHNVNQGLIIPIRRMHEFADRLNCGWALSNSTRVPEDYITGNHMSDDTWAVPPFVLKELEKKKSPDMPKCQD